MKGLKVFSIPALLALTFIACGDDETPSGPTPNPQSPWKVAFQFEASGYGGIRDMWFSGPNDGWACYGPWVFHYDGNKWRLFENLSQRYNVFALESICAPAPDDVWVAGYLLGDGHVFYHYDGTAWKEVPIIYGDLPNDIFFISPNRGWAAVLAGERGAEQGLLLYYDGLDWTQQWQGDFEFIELYFLDADNAWAYGVDHNADEWALFHFDGKDWEKVILPGPKAKTYEAIKFNGPNDGWLVGRYEAEPQIYHYDGATWTEVKCPSEMKNIYGADFVSTTDGWLVGETSWYYDGQTFKSYPWPYNYEVPYATIVRSCAKNDVWATLSSFGKQIILHFTGFN